MYSHLVQQVPDSIPAQVEEFSLSECVPFVSLAGMMLIQCIIPQIEMLTLVLLNTTYPVLANSVDPDQLASEEAN